jgi:CAI-1 autoinducer synthase
MSDDVAAPYLAGRNVAAAESGAGARLLRQFQDTEPKQRDKAAVSVGRGTAEATAGGAAAVASDIAGGIVEAPKQAVGGARDAGQEALDITKSAADFLDENVVNLGGVYIGKDDDGNTAVRFLDTSVEAEGLQLPEIAPPRTVTGGVVRGFSQFMTGFIPALKVAKAVNIPTRTGRAMAAGYGSLDKWSVVRAADALLPLRRRIDSHFKQYPNGHVVHGRAATASDVKLSGNDYLDIGSDPRILSRQLDALAGGREGVFMSGVYTQYLDAQLRLENDYAAWLGAEAAVLCQSGFAANEGLIQTTTGPETPAYIDMFGHSSFWQGAAVANAPAYAFRHNDAEHLRRRIAEHGPGVVVVEAIYSTIGDFCPLHDILGVCEETGSMLVVDESHAIGVIGGQGEGLVSHLGLAGRVPFRIFSLSKAMVGRGGVVVGPARFAEYFRYQSAPSIFSSAVFPNEVARFEATLAVVRGEGHRRARVSGLSERLRAGLLERGYEVSCSESQIIPLIAGPESKTVRLRDALEANGVMGSVFCAPATPREKSLIRLCVHNGLDNADIDYILEVCSKIRDQVRPDHWPASRRVGAGKVAAWPLHNIG